MSGAVNFVWNYCNETSFNAIRNKNKWLTNFDLNNLTTGCSKELRISAETINEICKEYVVKRRNAKKIKLSWRSRKRSLGWVPLKAKNYRLIDNDTIKYYGYIFKFWNSRSIVGEPKTAKFSQDGRGKWYINIQCEINKTHLPPTGREVGIDLGLKTIATLSDNTKSDRENITKKYEKKLASAQRANKTRLIKTIHAKITNTRRDWAHKETTKIIENNDIIVVGDVNSLNLKKTNLAKSVSDAGWFQFKSLLAYKAIRFGGEYMEVKENFSTVTCSTCLNKTGPRGLSALGVRE